MPAHIARIRCAFALEPAADGALPTEFRVFKAGVNQTTKGDLLFDDQAAADVMARYAREGVDLIVDLNHDSVEPAALAARSDASDARGWFQLELRAGELWAVNVRWTPDGARRLTEKTQRYISPVSMYDAGTMRVCSLLNVAMCAMPATLGAVPLVAATKAPSCTPKRRMQRYSKAHMSPELLKKILAAIAEGKDESGLLGEIVAAAAGAETSEPAGADPMAAAAEPAPPAPGEEPKPPMAASVSALAKALGCATDEEAAAAVLKLQKQVQSHADANAAVELETRRGLIARLVKLGIEKPGTAWVKDAKGEPTHTPVARLSVEPIAELRARVELHEVDGPRVIAEPPPSGGEVVKLSKEELAYIKKNDMTEAEYLEKKSRSVKKATK
jgi:hypothetical protein